MASMEMVEDTRLSIAELLGRPLNDVEERNAPRDIYTRGPMKAPLPRPRVSVIGTRKPSEEGIEAAGELSKLLVKNKAVVISGLASGIDTAAHTAAIDAGGMTAAVLGTPLDKAYPSENRGLQNRIMEEHLAVSQFPAGYPVSKKNFVMRNRTMALISDATVIVEAGDGSGTRHQGWEALRLGRSLFIPESTLKRPDLKWPKEMIEYGARELSNFSDIINFLPLDMHVPDIHKITCS